MKHVHTSAQRLQFKVLMESASAQAAIMVLQPGQSSSERPEDEHPRCEQWLFVIEGAGLARSPRRRVRLLPGSLLLIEKNEPHQISCSGKKRLATLNLYVPPAYTRRGEVRPSARRRSRRN